MTRRRAAGWVLFATFLLMISEGGARLALRLTGDRFAGEVRPTRIIYQEQAARIRELLGRPHGLVALDSLLGWRYRAGYYDSTTAINRQDLRHDTEYPLWPAPGVLRVAAFGDSFVYSNEVPIRDSWSDQVQQHYPAIEVLNFGVGGYGVDQAYLRYLAEGRDLAPHVVLIGFVLDDITRVVNVYRRFRSSYEIPLVKPRFRMDRDGALTLLPPPLRTAADYGRLLEDPRRITALGKYDSWYESVVYRNPLYDYSALLRILTQAWIRARRQFGSDRLLRNGVLNPESEAFRIQVALFQHFADSARARGTRPIILLFPDRSELASLVQGRSVLGPLKQALEARHLEFLDLRDAFTPVGSPEEIERWFMPGGHYSPAGNRRVAEWLGQRLQGFTPYQRIPAILPLKPKHRSAPAGPAPSRRPAPGSGD